MEIYSLTFSVWKLNRWSLCDNIVVYLYQKIRIQWHTSINTHSLWTSKHSNWDWLSSLPEPPKWHPYSLRDSALLLPSSERSCPVYETKRIIQNYQSSVKNMIWKRKLHLQLPHRLLCTVLHWNHPCILPVLRSSHQSCKSKMTQIKYSQPKFLTEKALPQVLYYYRIHSGFGQNFYILRTLGQLQIIMKYKNMYFPWFQEPDKGTIQIPDLFHLNLTKQIWDKPARFYIIWIYDDMKAEPTWHSSCESGSA